MAKNIFYTVSLVVFCLLINVNYSYAHQPNYVGEDKIIVDNEPAISKAYYGDLAGSAVNFSVSSDVSFSLYANILSPDADSAKSDLSVAISDASNTIIANIGGESGPWEKWYEEFAGDYYLRGPEFKRDVPAGKYRLSVSNKKNIGRYIIAIGEAESFPIPEIPRTLSQLYAVKTNFFGKPWYSILEGKIGEGLFAIGAAAAIIVAIAIKKLVKIIFKK